MTSQSPDTGSSVAAVPSVRPSVRVRNFRGRLLVAGPEGALELSESAAFIFSHIDGRQTVADLGRHLEREYTVPLEVAMRDTAELIDLLADAELIELQG